MARIKLDSTLIKYISLFQSVTRVSPRDCIDGESETIFVIPEAEVSRAIGKSAVNVKKIEKLLGKKVKIVGHSPELQRFIKNLVHPNKITDIMVSGDTVTLVPADNYTRGQLIGRNAAKLRKTEDIVQRYFDIKEIKVK